MDSEIGINERNSKKSGRHRKKQLYSSILQQIEFYFSDSNLSKDRFMAQKLAESSYVDLNVFLSFNKISRLTKNIVDIQKALLKSEILEVSDDKTKVCRKTPIKTKENVDECTIYVENIKSDANHEWLSSIFSEFGNVSYVSIPKYKQNKAIKGFAFVEFETESEAQNALDYFESIGCKMPSHTNPENLKSIATFESDQGNTEKIIVKMVESIQTSENENQNENSNKRKLTQEENEHGSKKMKTDNTDTDENNDDIEVKKKKKQKKDHRRKNYMKELGLKVLSKREWKKMRNKYLELQRKKMKEFKQYLNRTKFGHKASCEIFKKMNPHPDMLAENLQKEDESSKLDFTPGVIVKLKLVEPCADTKKLKNEIKTHSTDIKYVDIPLPVGSTEIFIRFGDSKNAKDFCQKETIGEKVVLENYEEKRYWEKLQNDRSIKFAKGLKKTRGRDKLLKRAEKELAKHMRFDDIDY